MTTSDFFPVTNYHYPTTWNFSDFDKIKNSIFSLFVFGEKKIKFWKEALLAYKNVSFSKSQNRTFLMRLTHDFGKKKTSIFLFFFYFS